MYRSRVVSVSSLDINVRNIRLERSNTDPFANEADVFVGSTNSKLLNAVHLLDKLIKALEKSDFFFPPSHRQTNHEKQRSQAMLTHFDQHRLSSLLIQLHLSAYFAS